MTGALANSLMCSSPRTLVSAPTAEQRLNSGSDAEPRLAILAEAAQGHPHREIFRSTQHVAAQLRGDN